jgi:hypothetical protein
MRKRLFGIFGTVFLLIGSAFAQSETLFSNLLQPVDTTDKPSFVFAGQSYATMFQTGGITTSIDGASFFISNEADGTHGLSDLWAIFTDWLASAGIWGLGSRHGSGGNGSGGSEAVPRRQVVAAIWFARISSAGCGCLRVFWIPPYFSEQNC